MFSILKYLLPIKLSEMQTISAVDCWHAVAGCLGCLFLNYAQLSAAI